MNNILTNPIFWSALLSCLGAQVAKCFVEAKINRKFSFHPLFTNGGMPSSHSAMVAGLTNSIGMVEGYNSTYFIIALVITLIVINDATNVRLETGKQAQTLNKWSKILEEMFSPDMFEEEHFKTLVGHTKLQVLWGLVTGLVMSTAITLLMTR